MFWAITCEAGKRYSQVPSEPFHVSMAALEPRDQIPENKQVSLMVEHRGKEFLLCTLEYERVMQVNLDLQFNKGEETFFFVNGEGTIHLSGYLEPPNEVDCFSDGLTGDADIADVVIDEYNDMEAGDDSNDELGTRRLLTLDDSGDEDSEDYQPEFDVAAQRVLRSRRHANFKDATAFAESLDELDDDLEEEEEDISDESDEDDDGDAEESDMSSSNTEEMCEDRKRKKLEMPGPSTKRTKNSVALQSPTFAEPTSLGSKKKKKKQKNDNVSMETHANSDQDDDLDSSIGRTPMPSKKSGCIKTPSSQGSSPLFKPNSKLEQNAKSKNKKSTGKLANDSKTRDSRTQVLAHGVEIIDLKVGNGPIAKSGKFIHVYYVGRLSNNVIFDTCKAGFDKPLSFRLGRSEVIDGWDIGLEGMRVGGKRFVKVPPEMAYGKEGNGPIPGNCTLLFTIELKAVS